MTTSNSSGSFATLADRVRCELAAERKLQQRVTLLRILTRRPSESPAWMTPFPRRSA